MSVTEKVIKKYLPPIYKNKKTPSVDEDISEETYQIAKQQQKDIYKRLFANKVTFLQYYKHLLKMNNTVMSCIMMGEAYMQVIESQKAMKYFKKALNKHPKHCLIIYILGEAFVKSHQFDEAISFYQQQILDVKDSNLKLKLAEIYMNLKQYQKSELLLLELQEEERQDQHKLKILMLLAQIQEITENLTYAFKNYKGALDICKGLSSENTCKNVIEIIVKLGDLSIVLNKTEQAVNFYKEGLKYDPNNLNIILALTKAYLQKGNLTMYQELSEAALKIDPYNELALFYIIRNNDFEKSVSFLKELLNKQPFNYEALICLVNLLKRTGCLEETTQYIEMAKKSSTNKSNLVKILYVEGLYHWYSGDTKLAIKTFDLVKESSIIGIRALFNIIEIYLSVDNFLEDFSNKETLKSIELLLQSLEIKLGVDYKRMLKSRLLQNLFLIFTNNKMNIEKAMEDLESLKQNETLSDNVGIELLSSMALFLLNEEKRAENQLKFIAKTNCTIENADYLEYALLFLSDIYIKLNKFKDTTELLYKILRYNKSCCRAHKYLGLIFEKEENFDEAVNHFTIARNLGETNTGIKLANCLMKLEKYSSAIILAKEILRIFPENHSVKEILEKSASKLRC